MQDTPAQPLRHLEFQLRRDDAHAFASLGRELRRSEKFQMLFVIALTGIPVGLLPDDLPSPLWWSIAAAAIIGGGVLALLRLRTLVRREAMEIPIPNGPVSLAQWPDRLVETSSRGVRTLVMTDIAQVIATDRHVFARTTTTPLIVPLSAFSDKADMDRFATWLDDTSNKAQP